MTRPSSKLRELVAAGGVGAAVLVLQVGPQPDGLDDVVKIVEDVTHIFQHDGMAPRGRDALLQFLDDVLLHEVCLAIVQPLEAGFEELDVSQPRLLLCQIDKHGHEVGKGHPFGGGRDQQGSEAGQAAEHRHHRLVEDVLVEVSASEVIHQVARHIHQEGAVVA